MATVLTGSWPADGLNCSVYISPDDGSRSHEVSGLTREQAEAVFALAQRWGIVVGANVISEWRSGLPCP